MSYLELVFLAVGLAMDAFAVSVCKGLTLKNASVKYCLCAGAFFGGFQALMPVIGYFLGNIFSGYIQSLDHWVAFALLCVLGINMIAGAKKEEEADSSFAFKSMLLLAVATSIDALAVGITFAFLKTDIVFSVFVIGIITFAISFAGVKIGCAFGSAVKSKAEIIGGAILIIIGTKILLEHLFF